MEYSEFVKEILSANSHSKQQIAFVESETEFEYLTPALQHVGKQKKKF